MLEGQEYSAWLLSYQEEINHLMNKARAEERGRCAEICRSHAQRALEKASGLKPTDDRYLIRSDTAMSLAAQISALGDE